MKKIPISDLLPPKNYPTFTKMKKDMARMEMLIRKRGNEIYNLKDKVSKLEEENYALSAKIEQNYIQIVQFREEKVKHDALMEGLRAELNSANKVNDTLKEECSRLENEIKELESCKKTLNESIRFVRFLLPFVVEGIDNESCN